MQTSTSSHPEPFRPEGLAQRLAPFVAAGSLGLLLVLGDNVFALPGPAALALALSLLALASLFHPAWYRFPRWIQALPILSVAVAVLWPGVPPGPWQLVAVVTLCVALLTALFLPWRRLPQAMQLLPPVGALVGILIVREAQPTSFIAAFPFILLVILWLALYHSYRELLVGMLCGVLVFLVPSVTSSGPSGLAPGLVYASVAVLMGLSVAQLLRRLDERVEDAEFVERLMRQISAGDPDVARTAICDAAIQVCGAAAVLLMELDEHDVLVPTAGASGATIPDLKLGLDGMAYTLGGTPIGRGQRTFAAVEAFKTRRPVFHSEMKGLPSGITKMAAVTQSIASLSQPVLNDGKPVGVLAVSWARRLNHLPDRMAATVSIFAAEVALVLQQADFMTKVAASEERLAKMAATDPLTGLANRREFDRLLEAQASRRYSVVVVDVDNLKELNDNYGHEAGDAALQAVGRIMLNAVRDEDMVARIGGDEFAAILPGAKLSEAIAVAERMRLATYGLAPPQGVVRISAGCAQGGGHIPAREVLATADDALYLAKESGRDRVATRDVGAGPVPSVQRALQTELAGILRDRSMHSVYQPIVSLTDRTVLGYEALARPNGQLESAPVNELFEAAQRLGFDRDLDWLCRRVALQGAHQLPDGRPLFINVGVSALLDPVHDVDQMLLMLEWSGRSPELTVLEITEREAVRDLRRFEQVLSSYRAAGFRFALDDVGEGHSTFEVLAAAVPEFIKISARFAQAGSHPGAHSAIGAAVSFAKTTGAQVIAEGLESEENIEMVQSLGVGLGQGYALARPSIRGSFETPQPPRLAIA